MLANIEALEALARAGTMGQAGRRLRVSQSAVSKRIAALEAQLGAELVAKAGRRVVLTPEAERLLERLRPVLAELKACMLGDDAAGEAGRGGVLTVGVSEAVLASWGAGLLRAAAGEGARGLELRLHAHRSPVVADRVGAGEYALGIVAGHVDDAAGGTLQAVELLREPMVLIGAPGRGARRADVITIEERSGTWAAIARRAAQAGLEPTVRVESFFAVARLALEGFGRGLVPIGVCEALGLDRAQWSAVRGAAIARPVSIVARKTTLARPRVQELVAAMRASAAALEARWSARRH